MPPKTAEPVIQITAKVPPKMLDELDALARELSPPDEDLSRAKIIRIALRLGMERLRKDGLPKGERPAPRGRSERQAVSPAVTPSSGRRSPSHKRVP